MIHKKYCTFLILLFSIFLFSCALHEPQARIFSAIDECKTIEQRKSLDTVITVYNTPDKDKYIKDLAYSNFYGYNYTSNDLSFDFFAYTFPTVENADSYFENVTKEDNPFISNFSSVGNSFNRYYRVVVSKENAYIVHTNTSDSEEVIALLNSMFSEEITKDYK